MSTYIKGPICGVDNCRSRLWRIINGRRTCQYGHVMEGDVEFNDDEDDINAMGVVTRRLNLTTNATGNFQSSFSISQSQRSALEANKTEKTYGREGQVLFLKSFQYILKRQTDWLISHESFPDSYSDLVKLIWAMHLEHADSILYPHDSGADSSRNPNDGLNHTDSQYSSGGRRGNGVNKLKLSMVSTISIHYLACLHIGLPVFSNDILRWICVDGLPYFRSHHLLPKEWQERLPNYYLQILDGGKPPHEMQLQHKIAQCAELIEFKTHFRYTLTAPVLLLKLTLLERIPGEFYFFARELLRLVNDTEELPILTYEDNHYRKPHQYPEIGICAAFIACIKIKLLQDEQLPNAKYNSKFAETWLRMSKLVEDDPREKFSKANPILKMTYKPATALLDEPQEQLSSIATEAYLDWIEKNLLPTEQSHLESTQTLDDKIAKRKLHNIVPLKKPSSSENISPTFSSTLIDDIHSRFLEFSSLYDQNTSDNATSVHRMVDTLIGHISLSFGLSSDQLREAVDHVIYTACSSLDT